MSKTERQKNQKSTQQIHIRLTDDEKIILEEMVKGRNISKTDYIKEKLFEEKSSNLYEIKVKERLFSISEILTEEIEQYCTDEKFIEKCRNEANELWRYLR